MMKLPNNPWGAVCPGAGVLLAALTGLTAAAAQPPAVSSIPVIGYYKFDVPVGTSIWTCGFVTRTLFQGKISTITPGAHSVIGVTGTAWPAFGAHYMEILTGPQAGLVLDIVSNTAAALTVEGDAAALGLAAGETFCVREHATLGKILKDGAGLTAGSDTVTLIRESGTVTYAFNGTNWEDDNLDDASDIPIYPGQSFLITHGGTAPAKLIFGPGGVSYLKRGPTKIPLYAGIPNLVGSVNPFVSTDPADPFFASSFTPLGDLGFEESLVAGNDSVEIRRNNGSLTSEGVFFSNGTNMEDDNLDDASGRPVRNGLGLIISVSSDGVWTAPGLPLTGP